MEKRKSSVIFPLPLIPFREAVDKAHQLCQTVRMTYLQQFDKNNTECVTLADYGVQVIVNMLLCNISPENCVIAEENSSDFFQIISSQQQEMIVSLTNRVLGENLTVQKFAKWLDYGQDKEHTNKTWVIDPIDGTQEFLKSNQYVIGIGVLENGVPNFSFLSRFSPERGTGIHYFTWEHKAYKYDPIDESMIVLQVSDRPVSSARPFCNEIALSEILNIGYIEDDVYSTLSAYISIATGESDVLISCTFKNTSEKIWDHVAGVALLQKAGGVVSDIDGQDLYFSQGQILSENKGVILSNGKFHNDLITEYYKK